MQAMIPEGFPFHQFSLILLIEWYLLYFYLKEPYLNGLKCVFFVCIVLYLSSRDTISIEQGGEAPRSLNDMRANETHIGCKCQTGSIQGYQWVFK